VNYPQRNIPQYNQGGGMQQDQHLRYLNNQVNMVNRIYDENGEDDTYHYPHNNMSMMMLDTYDHGNITEDNVNRSYQDVDIVRRGVPKRKLNRNHH
jgi:hypothetical protein